MKSKIGDKKITINKAITILVLNFVDSYFVKFLLSQPLKSEKKRDFF